MSGAVISFRLPRHMALSVDTEPFLSFEFMCKPQPLAHQSLTSAINWQTHREYKNYAACNQSPVSFSYMNRNNVVFPRRPLTGPILNCTKMSFNSAKNEQLVSAKKVS